MAGIGDNVHLSHSFPGFQLGGVYNSDVARKFSQLDYFS